MSLVATFDIENTGGTSSRRLRHSIYLGGKADAKDYDKLVNRWKITHVLNCTTRKQTNIEAGVPNYFEKPNLSSQKRLKYHRIPIYDTPASLPELQTEHEAAIVRFITKGLCHGNVLVHCSRGVSRSTTSVILYLMAKRGYGYEDALALIRRRRPEAQPIPAFEKWLRERQDVYRSQADTNNTESKSTTKHKNVNKGPQQSPIKKRRLQAPAGPPSIGTSPPPKYIGPAIGPTIGPASPPSIGPESPPQCNTDSIGPQPQPPAQPSFKNKAPSIGPELPPTAIPEKNKRPSIGPSLPP